MFEIPEVGLRLTIHPKYLIDRTDFALLGLWQKCRPSGMGGGWSMPFSGGVAEQPACLMAAMELMEAAYHKVRPKRPGES